MDCGRMMKQMVLNVTTLYPAPAIADWKKLRQNKESIDPQDKYEPFIFKLKKGYFPFCLIVFYVLFLVDECQIHKVLEDEDRDVNYATKSDKCDNNLQPGWYRFLNVPGIRMPTEYPPKGRCGTAFPGWLKTVHPTVDDGIVGGNVCFHTNSGSCSRGIYIKVKNCSSFYVYKLEKTTRCPSRYCYTFN